jgi:hypothetical protein
MFLLNLLSGLIFITQRGGADKDLYIDAASDNTFIGTVGALIIGGIIWWIIISTSNNKNDN